MLSHPTHWAYGIDQLVDQRTYHIECKNYFLNSGEFATEIIAGKDETMPNALDGVEMECETDSLIAMEIVYTSCSFFAEDDISAKDNIIN